MYVIAKDHTEDNFLAVIAATLKCPVRPTLIHVPTHAHTHARTHTCTHTHVKGCVCVPEQVCIHMYGTWGLQKLFGSRS